MFLHLQIFTIEGAPGALKVNLFCKANEAGMSVDQRILIESLETLGCAVFLVHDKKNLPPKADINIFMEILSPGCFKKASQNWFIPNPEWYRQPLELLEKIDLILCRTREVERIFQERRMNTYYLGFTTTDHYDPSIPKRYDRLIHAAGRSQQKGTKPIVEAWCRNPNFPNLLIVKNQGRKEYPRLPNLEWLRWLEEEKLRHYQNTYGIHLCLSETEGYGHYLAEAMAMGAVIITTDAPPMNEFIQDPRCLVPYSSSKPQSLGINYYVNPEAVEAKIKEILKLSWEELEAVGDNNRDTYLRMKYEFMDQLASLLESIAP